jgi:hypothetical protein
MKKYPLSVIPRRIDMQGMYCIDVSWEALEYSLERYLNTYHLNLNPEFQRGHVWTQDQQIKYIEFILSGGISGKDIYLNYPNWQGSCELDGTMVCVDGLQRLTAARKFMNNEFKIFGKYYAGNFKRFRMEAGFKFHINSLDNDADILQWYLEINSGQTPHTEKELDRVRKLLDKIK